MLQPQYSYLVMQSVNENRVVPLQKVVRQLRIQTPHTIPLMLSMNSCILLATDYDTGLRNSEIGKSLMDKLEYEYAKCSCNP